MRRLESSPPEERRCEPLWCASPPVGRTGLPLLTTPSGPSGGGGAGSAASCSSCAAAQSGASSSVASAAAAAREPEGTLPFFTVR